jgi:hypothetical protein
MSEQTTSLREKAISEGRAFAVIAAYLWMLFVLLQLHRVTILRQQNPLGSISYRVGFCSNQRADTGQDNLNCTGPLLGKAFQNRPLVYPILFKSTAFAVLLVCFDILEEVLVGLFHHKAVSESLPALGGGGAEGMLLVGLMVFIVLIPFFSFTEVA